jgi:hypothetical protein
MGSDEADSILQPAMAVERTDAAGGDGMAVGTIRSCPDVIELAFFTNF